MTERQIAHVLKITCDLVCFSVNGSTVLYCVGYCHSVSYTDSEGEDEM